MPNFWKILCLELRQFISNSASLQRPAHSDLFYMFALNKFWNYILYYFSDKQKQDTETHFLRFPQNLCLCFMYCPAPGFATVVSSFKVHCSGVCQNERNWFQNFVCYSICSFQHTFKYMYLAVIRSRPTAQSKVNIQHNRLNRKHITQNQIYECKNNIKLIYLNFVHCTYKFEEQITELNR